MRFIFCLIGILVFAFQVHAQQPYLIIKDSITGGKILKGIVSEDILKNENSFTWMKTDLSSYTPAPELINLLKDHKDSISLILFAGTWCEDSHYILPRLFKLLHLASYPLEEICILGVDRKKKTLGFLAESFGITRVPAIIIMHKGKEKGRIIEYGISGSVDKDFTEILRSL